MTTDTSISSIRGPALFLAQGWGKLGWKTLEECAKSAGALGYKGMQIFPHPDVIDLDLAAASKTYCDELKGKAAEAGCPIVEIANHLDGQQMCCNPAYRPLFGGFAPTELRGRPTAIVEWAQTQVQLGIMAAANMGFTRLGTFSGSYLFHTMYPWPQRPAGLVEAGFNELAKMWLPCLDLGDERDVDVCFELHPGEDLFDGATFERFLDHVDGHPRANILLDLSHQVLAGLTSANLLEFIRIFERRIRMFHVKDAELNPTAKCGVYGGYLPWAERPGRFRSLGDGQIPYQEVFDLIGRELGLDVCATVEWEDCAGKGWNQGVREGVAYVNAWLNQTPAPAKTAAEPHDGGNFDDFAASGADKALIAEVLGLSVAEVCTERPQAACV